MLNPDHLVPSPDLFSPHPESFWQSPEKFFPNPGIFFCQEGNPAFPHLPVPPPALGTLRLTFHNAVLAASDGGKRLVALKNEARLALETALRKDAAYVQSTASEDLALLLSSGFKAVSTNRTSLPLATPVILNVDNQATSKLFADLDSVANAAAYQARSIRCAVGPSAARRATVNGVCRLPSWRRNR